MDGLLALGKTDEDIFSPAEADRQRRIKERVIETGNPARGEVHISKDGMSNILITSTIPGKTKTEGLWVWQAASRM